MRFVDTNILLYAISSVPDERTKSERALEILDARDLVFSVQVLQEFYVQATRATAPDPIHHDAAVAFIRSLHRYPVVDITLEVLEQALAIRERWQLSYWDAAIVAASQIARCEELLTEDLQHGQDFDGVRVVNPFRRDSAT